MGKQQEGACELNVIRFPMIHVGGPTTCGALAAFPLYPERRSSPQPLSTTSSLHEAQEAGSCAVRELPEPKVGEVLVGEHRRPPRPLLGRRRAGRSQAEPGHAVRPSWSGRTVKSSCRSTALSEGVGQFPCVSQDRFPLPAEPATYSEAGRRSGGGVAIYSGEAPCDRDGLAEAEHDRRASGPSRSDGQPQNELRYPEGALGIAVVMNGRTVGIDLLDKPETLRKLWDRLVVLGLTLDAMDLSHRTLRRFGLTSQVV